MNYKNNRIIKGNTLDLSESYLKTSGLRKNT